MQLRSSGLLRVAAAVGTSSVQEVVTPLQGLVSVCEESLRLSAAHESLGGGQLQLKGVADEELCKAFSNLEAKLKDTQSQTRLSPSMLSVRQSAEEHLEKIRHVVDSAVVTQAELCAQDLKQLGGGGKEGAPWKDKLPENPSLKQMAEAGPKLLEVAFAKKLKSVLTRATQDACRGGHKNFLHTSCSDRTFWHPQHVKS